MPSTQHKSELLESDLASSFLAVKRIGDFAGVSDRMLFRNLGGTVGRDFAKKIKAENPEGVVSEVADICKKLNLGELSISGWQPVMVVTLTEGSRFGEMVFVFLESMIQTVISEKTGTSPYVVCR